jgi:hypothetical protein
VNQKNPHLKTTLIALAALALIATAHAQLPLLMLNGSVPLDAGKGERPLKLGAVACTPEGEFGVIPPGSELFDVVFVLDGSGSIDASVFELQKQGVIDRVTGPAALIPADGTCAVAVIQFSDYGCVHVPLTVIDSPQTADEFASRVTQIVQLEGGTVMSTGLSEAYTIFDSDAAGSFRFVHITTDSGVTDEGACLTLCTTLRTMPVPVRVCTGFLTYGCPADDDFLMQCANAGGEYPGQVVGSYWCVDTVTEFGALCEDCLCPLVQTGAPDCDANGVEDWCEILMGTALDCNENEIPDECDIDSGFSTDLNENGVPDECEDCNDNGIPDECDLSCTGACAAVPGCGQSADCNNNLIPDECDIASGWSPDSNGNGIPDECEIDSITLYVDDSAPSGGDGLSWLTPYDELQDALAAAAHYRTIGLDSVTIHVARGTYKPSAETTPGDPRSATFTLLDDVELLGGFAGVQQPSDPDERNFRVYETYLNGDIGAAYQNQDNCYHVVDGSGTNPSALLDGFIIRKGYADRDTAPPLDRGAGLYIHQGAPTVRNCVFDFNTAMYGAAITCDGTTAASEKPDDPEHDMRVERCLGPGRRALVRILESRVP